MDVVTHGLAGALVAWAGMGRPSGPVLAAAVAGAVAPDADALARLWDPLAPITVHRTVTHSLIGGVPLALGVTAALKLVRSDASGRGLAAFAYLGVLSHIALDLLTPFGTAALWPLDTRRFGLGWLYAIDPVVIAVVLGGLMLARGRAEFRPQMARAALVALGVYVLAAGAMSQVAERRFTELLRDRGITPARMVLVPVFPGPLRWTGVAETTSSAYRARFWLGSSPPEPPAVFSKRIAEAEPALDSLPAVRAFRAFARVPWRTVLKDGDARIVEYRDLAFEDHPWGGPMALRLTLDASGALRAIDLGHRL